MKTVNTKNEKIFYCMFGIILTASIALYSMLLGGKYLYQDEGYTLALIRNTYSDICKITAADVHPPLYYIIVKFFTQLFGYSIFSTKVAAIIPYIFIIAFGGIQFKQLFDNKTALFFMVLFFLFPFSFFYATQVRMYSMASAFVFANAVYAYRCFVKNNLSDWLLFFLSGTVSAYTHYFALVSSGIIYILLLIAIIAKKRSSIKKWIIASAATIICYLPWLKFFIGQLVFKIQNDYWIPPITAHTIIEYIKKLFGSNVINKFYIFAIFVYTIVFFYIIFRKNKFEICLVTCMLAVPICTIIVGVTASILVRPVFIIRYAAPSIPVLIAFMAFGLSKMKNKILISLVMLISIVGGGLTYYRSFIKEYTITENIINENFILKYNDLDCCIIETTRHSHLVLSYYIPEKPIYTIEALTPANPCKNRFYIDRFNSSDNNKVIVILEAGEIPSEKYMSEYECEYIGNYFLSLDDKTLSIFILTK